MLPLATHPAFPTARDYQNRRMSEHRCTYLYVIHDFPKARWWMERKEEQGFGAGVGPLQYQYLIRLTGTDHVKSDR